MMKSARALRRHHRNRLLINREHFYGGFAKFPQKWADTPKPCSCFLCCNDRRNDWLSKEARLTMQERRALQCTAAEYDDWPQDVDCGLEEWLPDWAYEVP